MIESNFKQDNVLNSTVPWKSCVVCGNETFTSPKFFTAHLKIMHSKKEGGSYLCTYGANNICQYLPLEGVTDKDYDTHVSRFHVAPFLSQPQQVKSLGAIAESASQSSLNNIHSVSSDGEETRFQKQAKSPNDKQKLPRWTVYDAQVNLAALLNDPRPGKRESDFFAKTWGVGWDYLDLTPPEGFPEISSQDFTKYLKRISPKMTTHKKCQTLAEDVQVPLDAFPVMYTRAHDKASADMEAIPNIYHLTTFDLSDQNTFNRVFPWADIELNHSKSKRLLQEKLSHYLDIIEVQISRQVALKSDAFFQVLTSHEDLQSRLSDTVNAITNLRSKCRVMEANLVKNPLELLVKVRHKQRLIQVIRKLNTMATLHQTQPTVQQLLSSYDFIGALDIMSTAQEVLTKELAGVLSFRHVGSQLAELERVIRQMINQEFLSYIAKYLNEPINDEITSVDDDQFTAIYMGLLRIGSQDFIEIFRKEITAAIKAVLKKTIIEYVSAVDRSDADSFRLTDQMKYLNYKSWLLLMEDGFKCVLSIIKRVKALCETMTSLAQDAAGLLGKDASVFDDNDSKRYEKTENSLISPGGCSKITRDLNDLVCKVCDYSSNRFTKLVNAKAKDMFFEKLSAHEFFILLSSVEKFLRSCEQICGSRVTNSSLRGCLQAYNNRFIVRFHEERKSRLNLLLDHERWRASEVPRDLQARLTHCELCEQLTTADNIPVDPGPVHQYVSAAGQKFYVVGTVVSLLKMMLEYCSCLEDLPRSSSDILNKLTEILRLFNSRSSQLILGAGALNLVGLKTISAKNLALLQRSLELILVYLPIIQKQFEVFSIDSRPTSLRHVDTLIEDYRNHITELQKKIRELSANMISSSVCQWEIKAPVPSQCFRMLCTQIVKFHEALSDIYQTSQTQALFHEINNILRTKLRERLKVLNITVLSGPQQGLVMADLAYFMQNVSSLSSVKLSLTLNDIVTR